MAHLPLFSLLAGIYFLLWPHVKSEDNPTKIYSSYRPHPYCNPSDYMRYPQNVSDAVAIVQEAIGRGVTVKAFGARHSQTDIICTEGIPVDMHGLRYFRMNSDNTATIGAGVNVRDATEFMRNNGRALRTVPGFGNITLGGAIGTGAHGSSIKYNASISSQVVGLTIVNGTGQIQTISDPADLKSFRLALGLLGIVVDVTLYTVPLYKTLAYNYVVSDEALTNGSALNWARTTDQISLYWFPAFNEVVVSNWTIVDVSTPGDAFTYDHTTSTYANLNAIAAVVRETASSLTTTACALASSTGYFILHVLEYYLEMALLVKVPDYVPIYTEDGYTLQMPAVGYYDLMFSPICYDVPDVFGLACPWDHGDVNGNITILDNEFGLALSDLPAFIRDVKAILTKSPAVFPLQGILMRFSAESDIYLSTAYGRETVHFEFYLWKRTDYYNDPSGSLASYQTILQTLTQKYKARSHWGKSGLIYHSADSLTLKLDPVSKNNFVAAMKRFDPDEVFINNFGRRMKGTGSAIDIDPLTKHCALLDNCICSKDADCGDTQTCTTLSGYTYRVCKTDNEIPEKPVDRNSYPPMFGVLDWLATTVPTLAAAALANCTLEGVGNVVDDTLSGVGDLVGSIIG